MPAATADSVPRLFEVRDLYWQLRRGDQTLQIRGSGLYTTAAPVLDEQRLDR